MSLKVIIAGGPGSGKSTLIAALEARGHACAGEAGRAILMHQTAIDGPAQHSRDAALYAELMLSWEMRTYDLMRDTAGPVFFDRGVPELTGYFELMGLAIPDHFRRAAALFRYHATVFVAPPWREIYRQDAQRRQDFDEAVRSHAALAKAYRDAGYQMVDLPRASPAARADFVLDMLALP